MVGRGGRAIYENGASRGAADIRSGARVSHNGGKEWLYEGEWAWWDSNDPHLRPRKHRFQKLVAPNAAPLETVGVI